MNIESELKPYSRAVVRLLKGVVDHDDAVWKDILMYRTEIQNYLNVIGLDLIIKQDDGFAFLRQIVYDDDKTLSLVSKRSLGFGVSVVLLVLRKMQEEFECDPTESQSADKYVSDSEIRDEVELFVPESYNRAKLLSSIDTMIRKVADEGFLVPVGQSGSETRYRIHKIIKERVTLDELSNFKKQLEQNAADESI